MPITENPVTVSISNIIPSGAGFGVVIGSGANCIIPSRVLYAANLRVGDLISCKLIDNPEESFRSRTPYMVAYVDPHATAALQAVVSGKTPEPRGMAGASTQLELPLDSPLKDLIESWGDNKDAPAPEPVVESLSDVRARIDGVLDTGGMWTISELRDALWPDDEFGSGDYRYKLLSNALRDLHKAGKVSAFGRRYSMDGPLTNLHYTRFPDEVRITWVGN